jgi:hypothetical protein
VTVDVAPIAVEDARQSARRRSRRDLLVVGHGHGLSGLFLGSVSLEWRSTPRARRHLRGSAQDERPASNDD